MSFQITLSSGTSFPCQEKQAIIEAAEVADIRLPHGCKNGTCGSCKCTVASGQWLQAEGGILNAQERATINKTNGIILPCTATPLSDMSLNTRELTSLQGITVRKIVARISAIERPVDNVAIVTLQLPTKPEFIYKAGQYLDILLRDGKHRSYSIASAPHSGNLVFHIRKQPKGLISQLLFPSEVSTSNVAAWKEKDILRLEGPFDTFCLNENSNKPIIFVASGTGFAPIHAIIESALHNGIIRPIKLYWGSNRPKDLYDTKSCARWAQQLKDFSFIPVISAALPEDNWQGRTGFVHQAVVEDLPNLNGYEVYACGAPVVVASARKDFIDHCNLPEDDFYADSFEFSVPQAPRP